MNSGGNEPIGQNWGDILAALLTLFIVFGAPLYVLIWKKIPASRAKWVTAVILVAVICSLAVIIKVKRSRYFGITCRTVVLLLIVFGAVGSCFILTHTLLVCVFKIFIVLFCSLLPGGL